ncbi:phosphopantetheine-binding protein [Paraburkholderia sp. Ac-20347]|jgi:acyl carrier protein|uniref:phosphopantetheine-binding protein n=1 Tax=Paraburkholderia sp. Ac-20347 TaxID=2703892 RepID=UPI00198192A2|nr:phosphopantetheine-binding protein [Paraburkholderia sp. Ac-20347]MBN3810493.1 acyl carrier protein [Paraburkholderia sp. Ac-20347]
MDSLKLEIKQLLIEALDLEHLTPADIDDDAPLFDTDGVGLDSIDALEIGIVLRQHYQLTIAADDENVRGHFRSISTLAALVAGHRNENETLEATAGKGD